MDGDKMELFNAATIQDLILLAENGENSGNNVSDEPTFTRKLLMAKVLVDRWENVMTDVLIHKDHESQVITELSRNQYMNVEQASIWGANLYFISDIPKDKVLVVSLSPDGDLFGPVPSRAVATFNI